MRITSIQANTSRVAGPASVADNVVPRFDATTGKLIQDSTFVLQDDGKFTIKSGANTVVEYGTTGSTTGSLSIRAMPPHGQAISFLPRSDSDGASHCSVGLTFDGPVVLPNSDPTLANQATRKSYVDAQVATRAPTVHTHAQSDVTNLVSTFALKAPLASPALTGTPTVPTAGAGTNTTQAASTAFVAAAVTSKMASVGTGAPSSPATGQFWWNTTRKELNIWDGTAWQVVQAVWG